MSEKRLLRYTGKEVVLSFQHMFAMFGATVLVPILANLSISMALIAAGVGTIIFYFLTKKKVPVFLGSSFAFLPALMAVVASKNGDEVVAQYTRLWNQRVLAMALSLVLAGGVYAILAFIIKKVGVAKIRSIFPPIVVGPVIIVIGMLLAPKMFYNNIIWQYSADPTAAWKHWTAAIITVATILTVNALAKPNSFLKIIPILLGFAVGYVYSICIGLVDFSAIEWSQIIIFQTIGKELGFYGAFAYMDWAIFASAAVMIVPLAIVTFMEHLGDISANSVICGKDFMTDPGLHRTVLGDGIASAVAGLLGAPANTTYGENTAVLAITKNYDTKNIFLAAIFAVGFGMFSIFGQLISTIPPAVIGGVSIILFGMISASGLRALVDAKVDFSVTKNLTVVSVVLAVGLGLSAMSLVGDVTGDPLYKIMIGSIEISPLAIATILGIILNLVLPNEKSDKECEQADAASENTLKDEAPQADDEAVQQDSVITQQ